MNFLAHFYLAAPEPHLLVGGFLGDFVKGPLKGSYSAELELGIRLHRHIDTVTDRHPLQKHIQAKLPKPLYRYSGIVSDMLCDHYLAIHWSDFHDITLANFNRECLSIISDNKDILPNPAFAVLERMKANSWLESYRHKENIYLALKKIGVRLRYENPLSDAGDAIDAVDDGFLPECLEILYDTRRDVQEWRAENILEKAL